MNATATTTQFKTPFTVVDFAGRELKVLGSKPAAVKFATAQDADFVLSPTGGKVWINPAAKDQTTDTTNTTEENDMPSLTLKRGKKAETAEATNEALEAKAPAKAKKAPREKAPVDPKTGRRIYKKATRRTTPDGEAITGRFELEVYGGIGETIYAQRPDATLRRALGIKWVELWALGIDNQPLARQLLAALEAGTTTVDEIIAPLGLEAGNEAEEDETA